ncbi:MAG: alpha/beta fold hydrolase [Oscillospiraceae bacterium]|nr:alpha/beta fold hydrolase [Oscillospiraceae bacterium]
MLMNNATKYPVLLVHGMTFRDRPYFNYWGRVPEALERMGCQIFYGHQDGCASVEENGAVIAERIREIIEQTGAEKVNIIAHSKGGLDSRYAISTLGEAERVASLTTVCTPHNGSETMDAIMKLPRWTLKTICFFADLWFRFLGDSSPNCFSCISLFTTNEAERFNRENPDDESIYYQSYAFVMSRASSDMLMWFSNLVVGHFEGENDGLLAPRAVKWGTFRGVFRGARKRGVSHLDEIDFRRRPLTKKTGDGVSDIVKFYENVVGELADKGF